MGSLGQDGGVASLEVTKKKVACQILVTLSKTLQYDMPDLWTAFSPNLDCKLPVSNFKPFSTDICATRSSIPHTLRGACLDTSNLEHLFPGQQLQPDCH